MGDDGAGKSTLVKVIARNFRPSGGEIRLDGEVDHAGGAIGPLRHPLNAQFSASSTGLDNSRGPMVRIAGTGLSSMKDHAGTFASRP
jgi:ABC-type cobalamin/Fe3+-siderophores transport system ATPase subunit